MQRHTQLISGINLKERFPTDTTVTFQALLFARRVQADFLSKIEGLGLTPTQANTLRELSTGEVLSQQELAQRLYVGKASMGEMLVKLEDAGFVARVRSSKDRRAFNLILTSKGQAATLEIAKAAQSQLTKLSRKMGKAQLAELNRFLNLANEAMNGPAAEVVE